MFSFGTAALADPRARAGLTTESLRPSMSQRNETDAQVSMCSKPPKNMPYSVLSVSNNCCFRHTLSAMHAKFSKLYKAKAYVQHYEDYGMSRTDFDEACDSLLGVVDEYTTLEGKTCPPANPKRRLKPVGLNFVPEY